MVKENYLRSRHKDRIHATLRDLEYTVKNCSINMPRASARAINSIKEAVDDKVLYTEEENRYKKIVSDSVKKFENSCMCISKIKIVSEE